MATSLVAGEQSRGRARCQTVASAASPRRRRIGGGPPGQGRAPEGRVGRDERRDALVRGHRGGVVDFRRAEPQVGHQLARRVAPQLGADLAEGAAPEQPELDGPAEVGRGRGAPQVRRDGGKPG
jgi:hypothetical protein